MYKSAVDDGVYRDERTQNTCSRRTKMALEHRTEHEKMDPRTQSRTQIKKILELEQN